MKRNILTKILLALMVVLLALSVVACKPKQNNTGDDKKKEETDPNIASTENIAELLDALVPLAQKFDAIENEMHADLELAIQYNDMSYLLRIQGDIYGENPENNQAAVELKEREQTVDNVLLGVYLKENVIYLKQEATRSNNVAKFSNLDGLELSQNLSKLPGKLSGLDLNLADMLTGLKGSLEDIEDTANSILKKTKALKFFDNDDAYKLEIVSEGLGGAVTALVGLVPDETLAKNEGILNLISNVLFGTTLDNIENAVVANLPELSINAKKAGNTISGIEIEYAGEIDKDREGKENVRIAVDVDLKDTSIGVEFPSFTSYVEGALKASLNVDLGVKGIALEADVYADPTFKIIDGIKQNPTAYVDAKIVDNRGEEAISYDIYAEYDNETEKLYFDIAALYDVLGADKPDTTVYTMGFSFFKRSAPENAAGDTTGTDEESSSMPFAITKNLLPVLLGKLESIMTTLEDVVTDDGLVITVSQILDIAEGILVIPDTNPEQPYGKEAMIEDLNELLAKYASDEFLAENTEATDAEKAASVIKEITGLEITISDIINATSNNEVSVALDKIEDALGIDLGLKAGNDSVLDLSIEIDIIAGAEYDTAYANEAYGVLKDTETVIDLESVSEIENDPNGCNVYYVTEGEGEDLVRTKKYYIVVQLRDLLEAYKQF